VLACAQEPALSQLAGSKVRAKQYAAVQQISGTSDADVVYLSFANHALGLCPYQIQLDRWGGRRSPAGRLAATRSLTLLPGQLSGCRGALLRCDVVWYCRPDCAA
jgi:hypothetical protein